MAGEGICGIAGKTIGRVIVKRHKRDDITPAMQVFLVFTDNTFYEIYSEYRIGLPSGLDKGGYEEALNYLSDVMDVVCEGYLDVNGELICVPK